MEKNPSVQTESFVPGFLDFLNASPSPFHAVESAKQLLLSNGYTQLHEAETWKLMPNGKYFFTRNHSTLFAFAIGGTFIPGNGFNIIGAHTDSPHLRVKPVSSRECRGLEQLAVETYGGGLWHTWFDRDLSVAGRVIVAPLSQETPFEHRLVRIEQPILRIPNLAIHLTTGSEREQFAPNKQDHLGFVVLASKIKSQLASSGSVTTTTSSGTNEKTNHSPILLNLLAEKLKIKPEQIRDFELCLCDTQPACLGGALQEFIFSGRLDNQCMSYCAVMGLINSTKNAEQLAKESRVQMITLFDHEEIGSRSAHGADSTMTRGVILRIASNLQNSGKGAGASASEIEEQMYRKSFIISADMAHAVHPNYSSRHDENHQPQLHKGVVIKYNSNQRYATNAITAFLLKEISRQHQSGDAPIPLQEFVVKNDGPCGSTIGPILSSMCGVRTIDVGCPQLSMHSIREMCGVDDVDAACRLFTQFFLHFTALDEKLTVD